VLKITDLSARVAGKDILKGLDLEVKAGEVHAIMGPNGSGKSTLAQVLAGRADYEVTGGSVTFEGRDLLALAPEERARAGLFLGFQYPVEIPGVNNVYLLKAALNAKRKTAGLPEVDAYDFLALIKQKMKVMQMSEAFLTRGVNEGFSGGEKKRNEVLQMLVLEPKLAILDETDSGLDIDALKIVSMGVNSLRDASRAVVLVTHYQRLLDYIVPDHVHVLSAMIGFERVASHEQRGTLRRGSAGLGGPALVRGAMAEAPPGFARPAAREGDDAPHGSGLAEHAR
jgi:Fe-S cluster assembly ATP-binding protein